MYILLNSKTGFPFLPCAPPSANAQKRKKPKESSPTTLGNVCLGDRVLTGTATRRLRWRMGPRIGLCVKKNGKFGIVT